VVRYAKTITQQKTVYSTLCALDKKAAQWNRRLADGCTWCRSEWQVNSRYATTDPTTPGSAGKIARRAKKGVKTFGFIAHFTKKQGEVLFLPTHGGFIFPNQWRFYFSPMDLEVLLRSAP